MNRKITALSLVLIMCLASVVIVTASDDASADERTGTIRPSIPSNSPTIYYSEDSRTYDGSPGDFSSSYVYFTTDPSEMVEKYAKGEIKYIDGYVKRDNLENLTDYWAVNVGWNPGGSWTWNSVSVRYDTIYLPAGTYEIEFSSSNMANVRCSLRDFTDSHYFDEFKDGNGKIKVPLTEPGSFYVNAYFQNQSDASSIGWVLNYKITPAPPEQRTVTCEKPVSIGTNMTWVHFKAKTPLPADTYYVESYMKGKYVVVARGSAEEASFLANVVDKGLSDASAYTVDKFDLTSATYVDLYSLEEKGYRTSGTRSFAFDKRIYPDPVYQPGYYYNEYVEVQYSPEIISDSVDYTFYAGQNFSIAVDFDTSDYAYVILRSGMMYICMDPNKLYTVKATSASEYQMYAVLADGSTGSINSANIKTYTEGVAEPDGAGMAFAAVSIGFCAIAFFLLFYLGRRPKWDDFVGLPEVGVAETVNEVPEVPEVPADETPPDQPPEE